METQKVVNLMKWFWQWKLKICNKKWYVIDSESKGNYSHENPIKFLTSSLESSLCDYSGACILVTGNITATPNKAAAQVVFKNCTHHLKIIVQKLTMLLLIMQILLIVQCICTL